MKIRLVAVMLLFVLALCGCGTTVVRPTVGEPATGPLPTEAVTTAPQVHTTTPTTAPETTAAPTTAAPTEAPEATAAPTTVAPTVAPETTEAPETTVPITTGEKPAQTEQREYVLNISSKKFHLSTCGSVKTMKPENTEYFTGTREELEEMGYAPCGNCKP